MKNRLTLTIGLLGILLACPFFTLAQNSCLDITFFSNLQCDDNGTPSDPSDDTWTVEVVVHDPTGLGTSWVANDPNQSSGMYDVLTVLGPFSVDLMYVYFSDSNNEECFSETQLAGNPCSGSNPCSIIVTSFTFGCVLGPTDSPSDNSFAIVSTVTGGPGTGSGWYTDDPFGTSGSYGTQITFGFYDAASLPVIFTIFDNTNPACSYTISAVPYNCFPFQCNLLDPGFLGITCIDPGTPGDPTDDVWTFNLNPAGFATGSGYTISVSNGTLANNSGLYGNPTPFTWTNTSGASQFEITITDNDDPACTITQAVTLPPGGCQSICEITPLVNTSSIVCNDNNTPTDPSDDTFTFNATVSGTGVGASWIANDPNGTSGPYDINQTFGPYPIAAGPLFFTITDIDDPTCSETVQVNPPATCSNQIPCDLLDAGLGNITCDDAGTPTFPDDDILVIELNPGGLGLGTSYLVSSPLLTLSPGGGIYGGSSIQQLLNAGSLASPTIPITITDLDDPTCSITIEVPNQSPCIACDIEVIFNNSNCDDNNTPNDPLDDIYTIQAIVTGTGTSWNANDPNNTTGLHNAPFSFGPYLIIDGILTFDVFDDADPTCSYPVTITPPAPCSVPDPCSIAATATDIICDNEGTPSDPSDDTFAFILTVNGSNTGSGWTDGSNNGNYGTGTLYGWFPIANGDTTLNLVDLDDPNCTTAISVSAPNTCSNTCGIAANDSNILCDDNGTPNDPSDDTFTFDLLVIGNNTGSGWTDGTSSGTYGTPSSYGPYPIANGDLSLNISDLDDPTCTNSITIPSPAPCAICTIALDIDSYACDDNNTPNDPSDDTYTVLTVVFGTGTSWSANDANNSTGLHNTFVTFGPFLLMDGPITFNIVDDQDPNCTVTVNFAPPPPSTCTNQTPCVINDVGLGEITCDDNGTPGFPDDDNIIFEINPSGTSISTTYLVTSTLLPSIPFIGTYGSPTTFQLPGAGASTEVLFPIIISDINDPTCFIVFNIPNITPCSDCLIDASPEIYSCDDQGTPIDTLDDTYTVSVLVTGNGTSWNANDPNNTTGLHNTPTTFGPFLISDGTFTFDIFDDADPNCSTPITLTPPAPCSMMDSCSMVATYWDVLCDNNGTPNDPSDDTFTFEMLVSRFALAGTSWVANDPNSSSGPYDIPQTLGPYPISGGPLTFTISDFGDPSCTQMLTVDPPLPCSTPSNCVINNVDVGEFFCQDNGTPNDPSDDIVTFFANPSGIDIGTQYSISTPGYTISPAIGTYGSFTFFDILNAGSSTDANFDITITDLNDPGCFIVISVPNLAPCSNCILQANIGNYICDDNGTFANPIDDTYTVDVSIIGTGTSWNANDPNSSTGIMNTNVTFGPYLISDGVLTFQIFDDGNPNCFTTISFTPPPPCSTVPSCTILPVAYWDILCADNGTPSDPSDDTFTFVAVTNGNGVGASWIANDPNSTTGTYGIPQTFGPYPISTGPANITLTDIDDPNCTVDFVVDPPLSCSTANPCTINNVDLGEFFCQDNGTPNDPSDDIMTFFANPTGVNLGTQYSISTPGFTINPAIGTYGSFTFFEVLNAGSSSDPSFQLTITDLDDPGCFIIFNIPNLAPCSNCTLEAFPEGGQCDDNGTPNDPSDDTFSVPVFVTGSGTSWNANDPNSSTGLQNSFTLLGPYLISNGPVVFNIFDDADATCFTSINLNPPAPCSLPPVCMISADVTISCNDNGTASEPNDDMFTFDLLVTGVNAGTGWTDGTLIGNYGTVISYGPFPITGGPILLNINDLDDPTCLTSISVNPPLPCSNECSLIPNVTNVICNDNNTPNDPSDDTYTFDFTLFGNNASLGWTDGTITQSYGSVVNYGPFPIAGGAITLNLSSLDTPVCQTSFTIPAPNTCSSNCTISATSTNILCNDNGTPGDPADDTFFFDLIVTGTNTGIAWTDGSMVSNYGTPFPYGPFPISGGSISLNIADLDDPTCQTAIIIDPPSTCSNTCSISANSLNINCNDNGTSSDSSDDTFTFDLLIDGFNTGSGWTDGFNSGIYGIAESYGPFPISGGDQFLTINDLDDPNCQTSILVSPPNTCSDLCIINAQFLNVLCDDNGTNDDPSDDTFTFAITVNGINTGAGWTDGSISEIYGAASTYGPFPIAAGGITLNINDISDPTCQTSLFVPPPTACSNCTQTVDAGVGGELTCSKDSIILMASSSANGSYSWTGPGFSLSGALNATVFEPGLYYFSADFSNNCIKTDSVLVTQNDLVPQAQGGLDTFLTCMQDSIYLLGNLLPGQTGQWLNGSNQILSPNNELLVTQAGNYYYQVINISNGCPSPLDEVIVTEQSVAPDANIFTDPGDTLDCVILSINLFTVTSPNVVYSWSGNGEVTIAAQIEVSQGGTYTLTALDTISGCIQLDSIEIDDLEEYPFIDIAPNNVLTCDFPKITLDASASQGGSNIVYTWYDTDFLPIPNSNNNFLEVTTGGFYYLELIDINNNCQNIDTVFVDTDTDVPNLEVEEPITLFCGNDLTQLNATTLNDLNNLTILWTNSGGNIISGGNTLTPSVAGAGVYEITIEDNSNGCIARDNTMVDINQDFPKIALLDLLDETCLSLNNGSLAVDQLEGGVPPFNYTLNGIDTNDDGLFNDLSPGNYTLQIEDSNGCLLDTSFVIQEGINLELDLPEVLNILINDSRVMEGITNVPEGDLSTIQWTPAELVSCENCLRTIVLAVSDQEYQLAVVHKNGCTASARIRVVIEPDAAVYIPNGFSPNQDGTNDYFTLFSNETVTEIETMMIVDRWGEIIFERNKFAPNEPLLGWDGTFRGQDMDPAVFVYVFEARLTDGSLKVYSGDLTLVR